MTWSQDLLLEMEARYVRRKNTQIRPETNYYYYYYYNVIPTLTSTQTVLASISAGVHSYSVLCIARGGSLIIPSVKGLALDVAATPPNDINTTLGPRKLPFGHRVSCALAEERIRRAT